MLLSSGMQMGKPETFQGISVSQTHFFHQLNYEPLIMSFKQAVYRPQVTNKLSLISSTYIHHRILLHELALSPCLVSTNFQLLKEKTDGF